MIRFSTSFITFLLLNTFVFGQKSDTVGLESKELSMITNRPGFTEASRAVFKSGLQIESGFQYSKDKLVKNSLDHYENILLPNLGLLYGVSKNVEVRVFANYEGNRFSNQNITSKFYYKIRDLSIGSKINLTKEKGFLPEMALLINQGVPTTKYPVQIWSTSALMAWSYTLSPRFGLSGNLNYGRDYEFKTKTSLFNQDYWGYTINLGYSITDEFGTYAELYGVNSIGNGNDLDVNIAGGFLYRINPKFQIDLIGGYQFESEGILVNAGFSWLLLKD